MPRNALYAVIVLVLAVTAAVVSFLKGNWLGVVWILMAGVASNIAWYHFRKDRAQRRDPAAAEQG
ncbi:MULTISPECIES: hypothetical protein [Kitasatospora]|uniref:Uncharacterized protein n=1 Tax=Kitasatospora setae (strain ATCC 33774 / DSM 43861 / JCM 3304 / KCC A-0304 / NBRC 14216 / KM-6054) TaxID=452652 RepID=E4NAE4_KITSK|nr:MULTISPECIES: hypothetical protein [Kitasatospora]BAJ28175.1 hypothetical protein KSE_23570 [Kitasatospora setae KM-6054]